MSDYRSPNFEAVSGWYIDSYPGPSRFGSGWMPEAGPFESESEAYNWLSVNRHKLMYPDAETRIKRLHKEEI